MRKIKLLIAALAIVGGVNSVSAQEDVTAQYLQNADLSVDVTTADNGWTCTWRQDYQKATDASHVNVVEFYAGWSSLEHTSFSVSQSVTLPAGDYRIAVNAFYRNGDPGDGTNDNKAYIFAGSKTQNVYALSSGQLNSYTAGGIGGSADLQKASNAFYLGKFSNAFDFSIEEESTIDVGFAGTFDVIRSWVILGPVKLYKYSLEDYLVDYRAKVAEAEALYNSIMNADVLTALKAAVVEESSFSRVAEVTAAIQTLTSAINAANNSIANYEEAKGILDAASIYDEAGQASYAANETIVAIQTAYDERTLTAVTAEQKTAATAALKDAYKAQTTPGDRTELITNPSFENDFNGWNNNGMGTQTNTAFGKTGNKYAESWQPNGTKSVSQTITALPAGVYTLSARAKARGVTSAKVYLGTAEQAVTIVDAENDYTVELTNENAADITLGFEGVGTGAGNSWICVDNFVLTYVHPYTVEGYQQGLADAITEAKAIAEGTIPTSAYSELQSIISANENVTFETVDAIRAATEAVQKATKQAYEMQTAYSEAKNLMAKANTLKAVDNDNNEANSTLANAIDTATTNVENSTTAAAIVEVITTLKSAMTTYVFAANPEGENAKFDCTFLMTNADVTGLSGTPAGWATEQEGGNFQVTTNALRSDLATAYSVEYWSENPRANDKFALYNSVNLPEGTYTMNCYAFASANGVDGMTNNAVYFYANDTQGSLIGSSDLGQATLSFVNNAQQDVKIGLKTLKGNQFRWMGIGYVELYKVPAQSYTVNEEQKWDNTQSGAGYVTLERTIKAGVNTLVLPFSMTQAEVEENFGEGSKVYVISSYNATTQNLSFATYDGISANKPCLLQATEAGTSYELADRTIVAGNPVETIDGVTMTGTYEPSFIVPEGSYIVSGGKIYNVDSEVTLLATRAYFTVAEAEAEGVRTLTLSLGDETTGIATLENGELKVETGIIYDLAGRKVTNPAKGIYVVNGKKVIK